MANATGKRYLCASCGAELLVTRGGDGTLTCCNQPMQISGPANASPSPGSPEGPPSA